MKRMRLGLVAVIAVLPLLVNAIMAQSPTGSGDSSKPRPKGISPLAVKRVLSKVPKEPIESPKKETAASTNSSTLLSTSLVKEGDEAAEQGLNSKAATAYSKAYDLDPTNMNLGLKAAAFWNQLGEPFEARRILQIMVASLGIKQYLDLGGSKSEVLYFNSDICKHQGTEKKPANLSSETQAQFDKLEEESRDKSRLVRRDLMGRAQLLANSEQYREASAVYEKLLRYTLSGFYHLPLARTYYKLNQVNEANEQFKMYLSDVAGRELYAKKMDIASTFKEAASTSPFRESLVDALGQNALDEIAILSSHEKRLSQIREYFDSWGTSSNLTEYLSDGGQRASNRHAFAAKLIGAAVLTQIITTTACSLRVEYWVNHNQRIDMTSTLLYDDLLVYIGEDNPSPGVMTSKHAEYGLKYISVGKDRHVIYLPNIDNAGKQFDTNFALNLHLQAKECRENK